MGPGADKRPVSVEAGQVLAHGLLFPTASRPSSSPAGHPRPLLNECRGASYLHVWLLSFVLTGCFVFTTRACTYKSARNVLVLSTSFPPLTIVHSLINLSLLLTHINYKKTTLLTPLSLQIL